MSTPSDRVQSNQRDYPIACYIVGISLLLYVIVAIYILISIHTDSITIFVKTRILRAHVICGAFGMLGASVASIRKYYNILITESISNLTGKLIPPSDWSIGWIYYYLTRPILGAILGSLAFLFSFIGFHFLADEKTLQISNKGQYLLYAIAFLSGFSVSHVLDRLEAISKQIFQLGEEPSTRKS